MGKGPDHALVRLFVPSSPCTPPLGGDSRGLPQPHASEPAEKPHSEWRVHHTRTREGSSVALLTQKEWFHILKLVNIV